MQAYQRKRRKWLIIFFIAMALSFALIHITYYWPISPDSWLHKYVSDFGGALTVEILGGFLFLFLAFYLDAKIQHKIDIIETVTKKMEIATKTIEDTTEKIEFLTKQIEFEVEKRKKL